MLGMGHDYAARRDDHRLDLNFLALDGLKTRKIVARCAVELPHFSIRLLKTIDQLILFLLLDLLANDPSKIVDFIQFLLLWVALGDFDLLEVKLALALWVPQSLFADCAVAFRPLWPTVEAGKMLRLLLCQMHRALDQLITTPVSRVHPTLRHIPMETALISQVLKEEL